MSTDDPTTGSTDDTGPGHPDFESLSAHLDGEAPDVAPHVAGCADCRTTLRWLRLASGLVATPVPPVDSSVRDQAVTRAVEELGRTQDAMGKGGSVVPVPPVPGRVARTGGGPERVTPIESAPRRRRGSGLWVGVGSAAAVLLAFVVGLGVLGDGGGGDDGGTVAAGPPPAERTTADAGAGAGAGAEADSGTDSAVSAMSSTGGRGSTAANPAGGVDGGDVGDIPDGPTLAARARPALSAAGAPVGAAGDAIEPPAPALPETGTLQSATPGTRPCEMEARSARPGLGTVVYYATGRVDGVPVVVLGFDPVPVTLLALAQGEGCRIVLEAAGP
jgi:hypothetical protein